MNEKFDEINEILVQHAKANKVKILDEQVFNAGIELGRFLEREKIASHRISFFIKQQADIESCDAIENFQEKINAKLLNLVKLAAEASIKEGKVLTYSAKKAAAKSKFSSNVTDTYLVQHSSTSQDSEEDDVYLNFTVTGKLADIFREHDAALNFMVVFNNFGGTDAESVEDSEGLDAYEQAVCRFVASGRNIANVESLFHKFDKYYTIMALKFS